MITHGSLFSGIGGFDAGFEHHGITTLWASEIDPAARRVLRHHWPDLDLRGDISAIDPSTLAPVDIISFGSPCQDLSVAGRRAGLDGERSGLFYEAIRIINGVRPAIAIWENVPGALSSNRGHDFGAILDALGECGALDIGWRVLDAQWFGVAQRRRRVFVVADFRGRRAAEILALAESLRGHPAPRREAREAVAHSIRASTAGRGTDDADRLTYVAASLNGHAPRYDSESETFVTHALTAEGHDASEDGTGRRTPLVAFSHEVAPALTSNYGKQPDNSDTNAGPNLVAAVALRGRDGGATAELSDVPSALRASGGSDKAHVLAFDERQVTSAANRSRVEPGRPVPTLNNAGGMSVAHTAEARMIVRRLTPTECCRLQGFPDDWLDLTPPPSDDWDNVPGASDYDVLKDSPRYRLLGNAVNMAVSTWLGERLAAALRDDTQ